MIIHLEPDILAVCEVKWALGNITTNKGSGGDGIPTELFQVLKDDAVKGLHSICQQIWKTQAVATGLEKVSFHSYPKCQRTFNHTVISHASKVMLKILQARLQYYVNRELPEVQAGFRNGRGTRDQIASIHWIIEKARESQKNIYLFFIGYAKTFSCLDHNNLCKILREMGIPYHPTCLLRSLYAGQKSTVRTGADSKLGKEYVMVVYCHLAYLTYMQNTS